jgi:hypothetical protein
MCQRIFEKVDVKGDGMLTLDDFKELTAACAAAAQTKQEDIDRFMADSSEQMWQL